MPRGVYERKPKNPDAPTRKPRKGSNGSGYGEILLRMRQEKAKYEDRVVALGTAIEAMEGLE
jgi:hypothetical protein